MTITRMYEVVCDYCGCAEHGFFNQANTDHELDDLLTKRVHQVCRNQRRPRY